MKNQFQEKIWG